MALIQDTVVVIAGPTASGKSALALDLAERFGGAVINADSQQNYRDLRILTARPDAAAEARAPHRLYGYLDAAERGSVARWRDLALAEIAAVHAAGGLPLLAGGTGLYLRALVQGLAPVPDIPPDIREEAAALYRRLGGAAFREHLAALDPAAVARFPAGDRTRLTRAYEVVRATGVPIGEWQQHRPAPPPPYRFATVLLAPPPRAAVTPPAAWTAPGLAPADGDAARTAVVEAGRKAVEDLEPLLKANGVNFDYPTLIWWTKAGVMRGCACRQPQSYGNVERELGA